MENKLKIVSLTSYSLIILMGQMIGLPFIFWLIFTSFEFGNSDQIFAVLGLIGLILNFTKYGKPRLGKILSFILMISPIVRRMTEIPIEKFNYLSFQIPLLIFLIVYLIYILKPNINKKTAYNNGYNSLRRNFLNGNFYLAMMAWFLRNVLADNSTAKP